MSNDSRLVSSTVLILVLLRRGGEEKAWVRQRKGSSTWRYKFEEGNVIRIGLAGVYTGIRGRYPLTWRWASVAAKSMQCRKASLPAPIPVRIGLPFYECNETCSPILLCTARLLLLFRLGLPTLLLLLLLPGCPTHPGRQGGGDNAELALWVSNGGIHSAKKEKDRQSVAVVSSGSFHITGSIRSLSMTTAWSQQHDLMAVQGQRDLPACSSLPWMEHLSEVVWPCFGKLYGRMLLYSNWPF